MSDSTHEVPGDARRRMIGPLSPDRRWTIQLRDERVVASFYEAHTGEPLRGHHVTLEPAEPRRTEEVRRFWLDADGRPRDEGQGVDLVLGQLYRVHWALEALEGAIPADAYQLVCARSRIGLRPIVRKAALKAVLLSERAEPPDAFEDEGPSEEELAAFFAGAEESAAVEELEDDDEAPPPEGSPLAGAPPELEDRPLAGVDYTLSGMGQALRGRTDGSGLLCHEGVPAGVYTLEVAGWRQPLSTLPSDGEPLRLLVQAALELQDASGEGSATQRPPTRFDLSAIEPREREPDEVDRRFSAGAPR